MTAIPDGPDVKPTPKVKEILAAIEDASLREQVTGVVTHTLRALTAFERIHLPQDHFEEGETARPPNDKHLELAPYVLGAVGAANKLIGFVAESIPPPTAATEEQSNNVGNDFDGFDGFDLEFDLVDGPTGDGVGLSHRTQEAESADPAELVADAVHAFAGMLRSRLLQFSARMQHAVAQENRWPLLAELDDAKHGLSKALQGVLFGVLAIFSSDARREEIYSAYRSAVGEAVALRAAMTDLSYHIGRFNDALATAKDDTAVPLVVAVADRLARFSARPEYRTLRAEDKKAVIEFRATLDALRRHTEGLPMMPLRHAVEGFSKFLEAMSAINHREVLVIHDRQRLMELIERIEKTEARAADDTGLPKDLSDDFVGLVSDLESVYGRNPELDEVRRDYLWDAPEANGIDAALTRCKAALQTTLATCG